MSWNFALNRQVGDEVFHPTSLVNFRHRLLEHEQLDSGRVEHPHDPKATYAVKDQGSQKKGQGGYSAWCAG